MRMRFVFLHLHSFRLNNISDFDTIKKIRNYSELGYNSQSDLLRDAVIQFFEEKQNSSKNLKDQKTEQEILKLKINNQLQLLRELNKNPDEIAQIIKNPETFKVDEIQNPKKEKKQLTSKEWDNVYGAIIDGYHNPNSIKICLACNNFEHFTDHKVRDHVIQNHPKEIREAIGSMGY